MTARSNSDPIEDKEATAFAMALLMPEEMVRTECRKMGGIDIADDKDIAVLARKFKVSHTLMAMRVAMIYFGKRGI